MDLSRYLDKISSVKDKVKSMKTGEKIILSVAVIGVLGLSDGLYQIIKKDIKEHKEKIMIEVYKKDVIDFVDKDKNGLSNRENFMIDSLMGVKDSSVNYILTLEDWKRAWINSRYIKY